MQTRDLPGPKPKSVVPLLDATVYLETNCCRRFSLTYAPSTSSIRDTRDAHLDRLLTVNFATTRSVNINVPVIHMNVSLLNPFEAQSLPTNVRATLEPQEQGALMVLARFDTTGRFVAAGLRDGRAWLWDLETQAVVRHFEGHVKMVTGLSWSRNSRFLLTASRDWNIIIWDLASRTLPPQRYKTMRFDAPIVDACFHPRNCKIILIVLATGETAIIDRRPRQKYRVDLRMPVTDEVSLHRVNTQCARFSPTGSLIFLGSSDGAIVIFNCRTKQLVNRVKIIGAGTIRNLAFDPRGRYLATNSADRHVRLFDVSHLLEAPMNGEAPEPIGKMSDTISRTRWNSLVFSGDGELVLAGPMDSGSHQIFVWDVAARGQFLKTIENGKEPLIDMDWHPHLWEMLSVTALGKIYIWGNVPKMKWSAFAAEFEEIDENVEYTEKETEFDLEDEEAAVERRMAAEEADVDIEIGANIPGQSKGGRINLGRNAVQESELREDEDLLWAQQDCGDDTCQWTFYVAIDEDYFDD